MEKRGLITNGDIKVPVGFRFRPTDEEIVVHYLKRKALSLPLPASLIPDLDAFQSNPENLPGDLKEKRYFFSKRNGRIEKLVSNRTGYWKDIGKRKQIVSSQGNQIVGLKRSLLFYQWRNSFLSKTNWVLHEYSLLGLPTVSSLTQKNVMELEDWVVHKVFQKKRRVRRKKIISQQPNRRINVMDAMVEEHYDLGPEQSSSPCSSDITDHD